jgi:hypothetical protein
MLCVENSKWKNVRTDSHFEKNAQKNPVQEHPGGKSTEKPVIKTTGLQNNSQMRRYLFHKNGRTDTRTRQNYRKLQKYQQY